MSGKELWDKPKRTAEGRLYPEEIAWGVYEVTKCPRGFFFAISWDWHRLLVYQMNFVRHPPGIRDKSQRWTLTTQKRSVPKSSQAQFMRMESLVNSVKKIVDNNQVMPRQELIASQYFWNSIIKFVASVLLQGKHGRIPFFRRTYYRVGCRGWIRFVKAAGFFQLQRKMDKR